MLGFPSLNPNSIQALSHLPTFIKLLGHVIHLWMANRMAFISVQGKLKIIFSYAIAYYNTFESVCPKREPSTSSNKAKILLDTIKVKEFA